jgi:hypothetical protein
MLLNFCTLIEGTSIFNIARPLALEFGLHDKATQCGHAWITGPATDPSLTLPLFRSGHSDYRSVSPYWVLPVYDEWIRAVWADDGGQATIILTK